MTKRTGPLVFFFSEGSPEHLGCLQGDLGASFQAEDCDRPRMIQLMSLCCSWINIASDQVHCYFVVALQLGKKILLMAIYEKKTRRDWLGFGVRL